MSLGTNTHRFRAEEREQRLPGVMITRTFGGDVERPEDELGLARENRVGPAAKISRSQSTVTRVAASVPFTSCSRLPPVSNTLKSNVPLYVLPSEATLLLSS